MTSADPKRRVLKTVFGFDDFRPGQEAAMDALLAGRHLLTVMPTGSGKSLCFQVPALVMGGLTLVVSPLVALMQDQVAALRLAGVAADAINSSQDRDGNIGAWQRAVRGETRLLYMAPERLMTDRMLSALSRLDVKLIAIDEAHCISQWGPSFRPEYEMLTKLRERFPGVPIAALTATADETTRADIAEKLFGGDVEMLVQGFDPAKYPLDGRAEERPQEAIADLCESPAGREWNRLLPVAQEDGGDRDASGRTRRFRASLSRGHGEGDARSQPEPIHDRTRHRDGGDHRVRHGIDKSDVRYVFHADLPGSLEAYYQEIGRAGRDGEVAEAAMLFVSPTYACGACSSTRKKQAMTASGANINASTRCLPIARRPNAGGNCFSPISAKSRSLAEIATSVSIRLQWRMVPKMRKRFCRQST